MYNLVVLIFFIGILLLSLIIYLHFIDSLICNLLFWKDYDIHIYSGIFLVVVFACL